MSVGDVYTSYKGNSSNNVRNLLTIDSNNNFSVISTLIFNPCRIIGDPYTNPNAPNNGTPQRDGTCVSSCSNAGDINSSGQCVCDFGWNDPKCQYSRDVTCSGQGNVDYNGKCTCEGGYAGVNCECTGYGSKLNCPIGSSSLVRNNCSNRGIVDPATNLCISCDGNWDPQYSCKICKPGLAGNNCQYSRAATCNGHGEPDSDGNCRCDPGWNGDANHQCQYNQKACQDTTWYRNDRTSGCDSIWAPGVCYKWNHKFWKDINLTTGSCDMVKDETTCQCKGINCPC